MSDPMNQPKAPSDAAITKFQEAELRIRNPTIAIKLWGEFFSEEEQKRLGGNLETAYANGVVAMWTQLHGGTYVRAVIEIAFRFNFLTPQSREWLLLETGELLNADAAYDDAILKNKLVLNSLTREVHWKRKLIDGPWSHEAKWSFVWELAKHAKVGLPVDSTTFGERKSADYVSKVKSELTNLVGFPIDLADAIRVIAKGTQKLMIDPSQIRLFEHHVGGEIREWTP
ncbi:hypothetical protein [Allorhodopirellula solitaria]|uniref:Uncharacterized protein n=1 Tax=Allorhodopirellula solitaria TaxID=2527987 RepID=A0A5C5X2G4_9BACT|nr:hypothetical protein [Allorhodopirellula solitaria]TWT56422.1 hypothetical protein CA85_42350 [Allorhodopirellula solitaria]